MARLILEENGARRAFNLREGKLTIGSGESCSLTLASEDVAEVHAELELRGDVATLFPRAGVTPPKVLGRPITKPTRLPKSAEFRIGSAVFRMQSDDQPVATGAAAKPRAARASGGTARPRAAAASNEERPQRIEHRRRSVQRGIPTWMVLGIIGVVCLVGYFVGKMWLEDRAPEYDPKSSYMNALAASNEGALAKALDDLNHVNLEGTDLEFQKQVETLRKSVEKRIKASEVDAWNMTGDKILEQQLKGYEGKYLKGSGVTRAKARLFIKRCDDFAKTYPEHSQLDWVKRYRKRWIDKAEFSQPDDVEDVTWEVYMLTNGKPRDYATVFSLLESVLQRAEGEDRDAALALIDEHTTGREEYFLDRMLQSKFHWEKKEYGAAVEWLVQVITKIGDDDMRDQATDALLKMTNQEGIPLTNLFLGGYQSSRPWQFEELIKDPRIKSAAKEAGLL